VLAEGAGLTGLDFGIVLPLMAIRMCAGGIGIFHTASVCLELHELFAEG